MAGNIEGLKPPFIPIGGLEGLPSRHPVPETPGSNFHDLLLEKLGKPEELKFSAHAWTRMQSRNIQLDGDQMGKLVNAVNMAQQKGASDSLILMNDVAFIVNVNNRTVITAMDEVSMKENVFTKIDSAVIVK